MSNSDRLRDLAKGNPHASFSQAKEALDAVSELAKVGVRPREYNIAPPFSSSKSGVKRALGRR